MRTEDNVSRGPASKKPRKAVARAVAYLTVGVMAAVAAALLLTRYMDARTAAARVPTVRVAVAKMDIPVATPIRADWVGLVDWPAASIPAGSFTDPAQLVDRVAIAPLSKNEAILATKLAQPGAHGGLATLLPDGTRAVAVRVDDVVGVAGFIHPSDRVDVIVTMKPRDNEPETSKIILQNVKVLAVGKDVQVKGREAEKTIPATVATLMVTPQEAEQLALAATKGKLLLALRGITDEETADTRGAVPQRLLGSSGDSGPPPASVVVKATKPVRPQPTRVATPAPKPPEKQVVEILRGDLFEKRDFAKGEAR